MWSENGNLCFEEQSSRLKPQPDNEKPQSAFQDDPYPGPNLDPPLTDNELKEIIAQELQILALEVAENEEFQNLALKTVTGKELEEELKQTNNENVASEQAINGELERGGFTRVIGEMVENHDLEKNEKDEKETGREVDGENESKNDVQRSVLEESNEEDVREEKENSKGEEDVGDSSNVNENENVKDENASNEDSDNWSEDEEGEDENNNETENVNENESVNMVSVLMLEDGRKFHHPLRPDAEDCTYYMKTGMCKFGSSCKFNHPPGKRNQVAKEKVKQEEEIPERPGQTECKYYLTAGRCKFGKACRYNHSRGKTSVAPILEFNFLGLPIRLGEKECPYYMRNGSCKYGSNCRFNHPNPKAVGLGVPLGYGNGGSVSLQGASQSTTSSWSSPRTLNETDPFVPMMFSPTQGIPSPNPEWNGYQAPVFAMNSPSPATETNFYTHHHQQMLLVEGFPERPGQPECSFFLKTGDCKYKSNCKFHHPKRLFPETRQCILSDKGLPLRPDRNVCSYFNRYGICKFGPSCKFDHPENYGNSSAGYGPDQHPFNTANGARVETEAVFYC